MARFSLFSGNVTRSLVIAALIWWATRRGRHDLAKRLADRL
jgi:hypothetical protein